MISQHINKWYMILMILVIVSALIFIIKHIKHQQSYKQSEIKPVKCKSCLDCIKERERYEIYNDSLLNSNKANKPRLQDSVTKILNELYK